jgi:hypothetical protein
MKNTKMKSLAIMIALILVSSTAISLVSLPTASAHDPPWEIHTTAYVSAQPNPVGVGQEMLIVMLINWVMPGALIQNDIRPHGYQLTITAPDGTNETNTYDPYDSGSSRFIKYTPTQTGNYTVSFVYPGEVYNYPNYQATHPGIPVSSYYQNGIYNNDTFLGSSAQTKFTVQQDPVAKLPGTPLPTEYWTRPIFGQNSDWGLISSNWVSTASSGAAQQDRWQKEGSAPRSAHVMWTTPARFGGWVGGVTDTQAQYYLGFSYEDAYGNPLILNGILYYQEPFNHAGSGGRYRAVNIRTGELLWENPALNERTALKPSKGQLLDFQQADQHGTVNGLLWAISGSTWIGYDAFSGNWVVNLTGVPSGTEVYTAKNDILRYVINSNAGWIALWNSTAAMTNAPASSASYGPDQQIRIVGQVIDASKSFVSQGTGDPTTAGNSYTWNVSLPAGVPTGNKFIVGVIPGDIILMSNSTNINLSAIPVVPTNPWTMFAISDNPDTRGQLLWSKTYQPNPNNYTQMLAWYPIDPINKVWTMTYADTGERLGFSMTTGEQLWGPVGVPDSDINGKGLQYYSSRLGSPAFGNLYVSGYGGQVIAYSMKDGTTLWTWDSPNSGIETPWGHYPVHIGAFADGMVFAFSGEHSPNTPIYKGYRVYAINATDGTEVWNILDWSASGLGTSLANTAIADGYMTFLNGYDEQVYVIGKGPSATSVEIQNNVAPAGTPVIIQGRVIDISAGTKQDEQASRFPNGVPAVSDASQSAWMSYVYQQQPKPTNVTGVNVSFNVIDSNGNYRSIGTATTDATGTYSLLWTPDIEGAYSVIANFEGSNSYFVSSDQTYFYAAAAAPTPAPTQVAPASMVDQYFVPAVAGIILAIILVGVAIILVLRKRP